jgi:TatD DNase family protein
MLIDTHCHLNDFKAFPDPAADIEEAARLGVGKMIVVGVEPAEWGRTVEICEAHPELFCILGWHPNYTKDYDPGLLVELSDLISHPKSLALGEIGLDYHWDYSPPSTQHRALTDQLDLAAQVGKPVVFHAREAYSDLLDVLEGRPVRPYLFHCFAGSQEEAERAVRLGAFFGVDGPISYKKADDLRSIVRGLPKDRLVVETDSPYMTPVPHRGKPNRPAYVRYVAEALAECLGIPIGECEKLTTTNAVSFFGNALA